MNKLLKIGVISGLIAGFVVGIIDIFIYIPSIFKLILWYYWLPPPPETPFTKIATNEIINALIWGAIIGLIYAWVYRVIPGKGVSKGIVYGLFNYLIYNFYWATYNLIYWHPKSVISNVIYLPYWIVFGLVLGILYEFLRSRYYVEKEPRIVQYDMMGGFQPGVIAGFLGAFSTFFTVRFIMHTGIGEVWPLHLVDIEFDISLLLSQLGSQIMWHLMWGVFLALIYPKVYNLVPSKGIIKGLVYGLVANYMFNELRMATTAIGYGYFAVTVTIFLVGGINAIIYGLVLGYLYRKPTEAIVVKKEKTLVVKAVNCIHCGASIPKGNKFCGKCGKKQ